MAYGFSVFWLPLSRRSASRPGPAPRWLLRALVAAATGRSRRSAGSTRSSSSFSGSRPRCSADGWSARDPGRPASWPPVCWGGGFLISALGVHLHQIWLLWLGSGVIGGCGLGLGYISPVSTLIKWFPDRRGMATGMAIMGFGGGAHDRGAAGRSADEALTRPRPRSASGRPSSTMGAIYFVVDARRRLRLSGARRPDWKPAGWTPSRPPERAASSRP